MDYNNLLSTAYVNSVTSKGLTNVNMPAMKTIHGKNNINESVL